MEIYYVAALFIFGIIIGSFLNVVILRHGTGRSLEGRSGCMSCAKKLSWYELVPVLSWCVQVSRCRGCGSKISWQYPLVEFATGLLFAGAYAIVFLTGASGAGASEYVALALLALICATLVAITAYDIKHMIIPDSWSVVFAASSLLFASLYWFDTPLDMLTTPQGWLHLASGPILFVPFWALWFFSKGAWIGLGDGKLAVGIGWLLGLVYGISAIVVGFWLGAIFGVALLLISRLVKHFARITMKSEIPFGPFLILGALLILFLQVNVLEITNLFI